MSSKTPEQVILKRLEEIAKKRISKKDLLEDIGVDSLDLVELIVEAEEFFAKEIPDQELQNMKTVQDVINAFK